MSAPVRALTSAEERAFRVARLVAAELAPYFMHALSAAAPVAAPVSAPSLWTGTGGSTSTRRYSPGQADGTATPLGPS